MTSDQLAAYSRRMSELIEGTSAYDHLLVATFHLSAVIGAITIASPRELPDEVQRVQALLLAMLHAFVSDVPPTDSVH